MFGAPSPQCPIPENSRRWLDEAFPKLVELFGEGSIRSRKVLVPTPTDFPIRYTGETGPILDTLQIVATQMEVAPDDILLDFYDDGKTEISSGSPWGSNLYLGSYKNISPSGGLYWGRQEDGKYHIWMEKRSLHKPEKIVALLAHEIAHIKLLGEGRIEKNDEALTDLTTTVFGLGIFNANAAFEEFKTFRSWGYSSSGYLKQREWGYGLAQFARLRGEKDPEWTKYLTRNIRSDFAKCQAWLDAQD